MSHTVKTMSIYKLNLIKIEIRVCDVLYSRAPCLNVTIREVWDQLRSVLRNHLRHRHLLTLDECLDDLWWRRR